MHAADVVIDITEVDSSPMYPLGQEFYSPATSQASVTTSKPAANTGPRVWVYVFNDEASTAFAQGTIVMRDEDTATYDGIATTGATIPAIRLLGGAQHAVAAGSYGWILKRGVGKVLCNGSVSAHTAICTSSTAQQAVDYAAGEEEGIFGFAIADDAGAGSVVDAMINCPG